MRRWLNEETLCSVFAIIIIILGISEASTISVSSGQRIQSAIDSAIAGDVIEVHSGIYYENLVILKPLVLKGIGFPVVDARGGGDAITISANGVILQGFNAINSSNIGIKVNSNNNTIADNIAANNEYSGIGLEDSANNTISGNAARNNGVSGISLEGSANNILQGNIAEGNNDTGIEIEEKSDINCILKNLVINNSNDGIEILSSFDNTLKGNIAKGNKDGFCIEEKSKNNTIAGNNATGNHIDGILLRDSTSNLLADNNVTQNSKAIFLESSSENLIMDNNVSDNLDGVHLNYYSSENRVYHNSLVDSTNYNAYDESGKNQWDNGTVGNYYSDYIRGRGCIDAASDGICDSAYSIPGSSITDRYPMANKA